VLREHRATAPVAAPRTFASFAIAFLVTAARLAVDSWAGGVAKWSIPMSPGRRLADRFVIDREIGAGGMGTVYRALDQLDGTPVAVKVLHLAGSLDRARFARKAALLAQFLVMEWLEGHDLAASLSIGALGVPDVMTPRAGLGYARRALAR
jgi:hypothetical protein